MSQIERSKTRPSRETIAWLAGRLGADPAFLETGVSSDEQARIEAVIAQAHALVEANDYGASLDLLETIKPALQNCKDPNVECRVLSTEARARVYVGEVRAAVALLARAREVAAGPSFTDIQRAEVLFQLGVCRVQLSSMTTAIGLFSEALSLIERSDVSAMQLESQVLYWRSRCYRQQRDYVAAQDDVERALALAESQSDSRTAAHSYFQASLIAERRGHWIQARAYAEQARLKYEEVSDRQSMGRILNNLGGLAFLLGKSERAISYFTDAFRVAVELGDRSDAGYAVESIARVRLALGDAQQAEADGRRALDLLGDEPDAAQEIANANLVIGRALMAQGKLYEARLALETAERIYEQCAALSRRANAWVALGDLAAAEGNETVASKLYRQAAAQLQDVRF